MWIIHSENELLRKENILMRILFCKIHCPFICFCKPSAAHLYTSTPLKLENTPHVPSTPVTTPDNKLTTTAETTTTETETETETEVNIQSFVNGKPDAYDALKSCIRKPPSHSNEIQKKKVQWKDNLGKELAETKEFESSETWETANEEEDNSHCLCVIL